MIRHIIRVIGGFGDNAEYDDFQKTLEQIENLQRRINVVSKEINDRLTELAKLKYDIRVAAAGSQNEQVKEKCVPQTELVIRWGKPNMTNASLNVRCVEQRQTTALANILRIVMTGQEHLLDVQEVEVTHGSCP